MKEKGYRFYCIIKNDFGSLFDGFDSVSERCIVYHKHFKNSFINKYKKRIYRRISETDIKKILSDVDFIISNTITNGDILPFIKGHYKVPIITYVHELKTSAEYFTNERYLNNVLQLSDHFLVPSNSVKCFLQRFSIDSKKISIINSFAPFLKPVNKVAQETFKKENSIEASFVVGGMGTLDWRKGPDIFVQVAKQVFKLQPDADIQFVWKGGFRDSIADKRLIYDVEKSGLKRKIVLIQHSENVNVFFEVLNLFALTSREEPLGLVMLEAAMKKVPTICFYDIGGAPEFIETDAGTVVDYLDVVSMAKQVLRYYNDYHLLSKHGAKAFEKVTRLHQDKELIIEQMESVFRIVSEIKQLQRQ